MCVVKGQGHVWPSKFKGQGYGQGQTHGSHLRPGVQSICLLFVSWQSDHFWLRYRKFHIWPWKFMVKVMAKVKPDVHIWGLGVQSICLLFVSWQSDHFWLRYSKFYIWPWKFKVKVMAKVEPDGHIWALEFNRYVCFSFHGNRTIFGRDIANSIFDLEKSRSRSRRKSTKIYSGNLQVRANNHAKNERNPKKLFKSYRVNKNLRPAAAYEPVQKHKVTPRIPGWLNNRAPLLCHIKLCASFHHHGWPPCQRLDLTLTIAQLAPISVYTSIPHNRRQMRWGGMNASVVREWSPACLHKLLPRELHTGN